MNDTWIETFTGRRFYPLDPRPLDIDIEDIAHALSMICRFTGHVRQFYSVAEHSVRVSRACCHQDALWALLHDASEAYVADMSRPLKHAPEMYAYRSVEKRIMDAVTERFGLSPVEPPSVKDADNRLLVTEKRDLMPPSPDWEVFASIEPLATVIKPWTPATAEFEFMFRFHQLRSSRG